MTTTRTGRDKEFQAVTTNLKEDQMLDRTLSVLKIEETYALQILQVANREVQMRQKSLMSKVSKIKSHLSVADIANLREQELQGRFKPILTPVNVSSATRIAAAERRLNLGMRRTKSWTAVSSSRPKPESPAATTITNYPGDHVRQVQSARTPRQMKRSLTADEVELDGEPQQEGSLPGVTRDGSLSARTPRSRPFTSLSRFSSKSSRPLRPQTAFSAHKESERASRATSAAVSGGAPSQRCPSSRRTSCTSIVDFALDDGTLSETLAKTQAAERRQDLINTLRFQGIDLERKKEELLGKIKELCAPAPDANSLDALRQSSRDSTQWVSQGTRQKFRTRQRVGFRNSESLDRLDTKGWKELFDELKKCRYLRLPPGMEDLSGVSTVANAQFHLIGTLGLPQMQNGSATLPSERESASIDAAERGIESS